MTTEVMVQAIINITENANRVLNIVKAKYGLKDKSAAINAMAQEYKDQVLERPFRPAFVKEALRVHKEKPIKVGTVENLRKRVLG